jgi:hypothetical protein
LLSAQQTGFGDAIDPCLGSSCGKMLFWVRVHPTALADLAGGS